MAVSGIVLRPNLKEFGVISAYYASAPHEPTKRGSLPIGSVAVYRPDFLHLLEAIVASRKSHIVVVSHGSVYGGLSLGMAPETNLLCKSYFDDLRQLAENWESSGSADAGAISAFASSWSLHQDSASRLVRAVHTIRGTPEICVALHVRGCEIGADRQNLRDLQKLLGCQVVSAPKCPMLYTPVFPSWGNFAQVGNRSVMGRRFTYEDADAGKFTRTSNISAPPLGHKGSSRSNPPSPNGRRSCSRTRTLRRRTTR